MMVRELFQIGVGAPLLMVMACVGEESPAETLDVGPLEPPAYQIEFLPQLDTHEFVRCTMPGGFNDDGTVVGSICSGDGFIWSAQSGAVLLTEMFPDEIAEAQAFKVENGGEVLGIYVPRGASGGILPLQSFYLTGEGELTHLPPLMSDATSLGYGINNGGLAVGVSESISPETGFTIRRAVYWRDGSVRELGSLGFARAVNEDEVIVGTSTRHVDDPQRHAFRWTESGGIEELQGLSEETDAEAVDVNDSGIVVGQAISTSAEGNGEAVMWDASGAIHQLPRIRAVSAATAIAISNNGFIIGVEHGEPDYLLLARIWIDGEVYDLTNLITDLPPDVTLSEPVAINQKGEIVMVANRTLDGQVETVTAVLRPILASE